MLVETDLPHGQAPKILTFLEQTAGLYFALAPTFTPMVTKRITTLNSAENVSTNH